MGMDFMSLSGNDYVPSGILLPDLHAACVYIIHDECSLSLSLSRYSSECIVRDISRRCCFIRDDARSLLLGLMSLWWPGCVVFAVVCMCARWFCCERVCWFRMFGVMGRRIYREFRWASSRFLSGRWFIGENAVFNERYECENIFTLILVIISSMIIIRYNIYALLKGSRSDRRHSNSPL